MIGIFYQIQSFLIKKYSHPLADRISSSISILIILYSSVPFKIIENRFLVSKTFSDNSQVPGWHCPSLMHKNIISSKKLNLNLSPSQGCCTLLLPSHIRITSHNPQISAIHILVTSGDVTELLTAIMCYFYCLIGKMRKGSQANQDFLTNVGVI